MDDLGHIPLARQAPDFSGEVLPTEKLSMRKIREVLQLTFVGQ